MSASFCHHDFLLQTNDESSSKADFIIRAETLEVIDSSPDRCKNDDFISTAQLYTDHIAEAILHYGDGDEPSNAMYEAIAMNSNSKSVECFDRKNCTAVNCPFQQFPTQYGIRCIHISDLRLLEPVRSTNLPSYTTNPDNTLFFNFGFEGDGSTSSINGRNFRFPPEALQLTTRTVPNVCVLSTNRCNGRSSGQLVTPGCLCTHIRAIKPDQTYRFIFTAVGPTFENWNFAHPVHLHGHSFHVTEIGFGNYDTTSGRVTRTSNDQFCTNPSWNIDPDRNKIGQIDPRFPLKDTILIPSGGYAVVYFISNNPGYWFLHCHIEVHQLEGMAVVINEAPGQHNEPPPNMGECGPFTWNVDMFKEKCLHLAVASAMGLAMAQEPIVHLNQVQP